MKPSRPPLARLLLPALFAVASLPAVAGEPVTSSTLAPQARMSPADEAAVRDVVERFRTTVIARDKAGFLALFLPGANLAWESAIGDDSLRRLREKRPQTRKVKPDPRHTPASFIDGIVADAESSEEKFRNLRIDGDGDIASVVFDYSFHAGGRETNNGVEAWHLVRTEAGWRIVSVIWSMNLPPRPAAAG